MVMLMKLKNTVYELDSLPKVKGHNATPIPKTIPVLICLLSTRSVKTSLTKYSQL